MITKTFFTWFGIILLQIYLSAENVRVEAGFEPSTISSADNTVYKVRIFGTQKNPTVKIPNVDGLEISKKPQSFRSASFIEGVASLRIDLSFEVKPKSLGTFQMPSWEISVDNQRYSVPPAILHVLTPSEIELQAEEDLKNAAFLELKVPKSPFYKDEPILSELTLFMSDRLQVKRIENPPIRMGDAFTSKKLGKWTEEKKNIKRNEKNYSTFTWPVTLTPRSSGDLEIGFQVNLRVRVNSRSNSPFSSPFFNDPFFGFGREETLTVSMPPLEINVKPSGPSKKDFKIDPNINELLNQKTDKGAAQFYKLGVSSFSGIGVPIDYDVAFKNLNEAAHLGHPKAQHLLGMMYMTGLGNLKNLNLAYAWFSIAKEQNISASLVTLNMIKSQMSFDQIIEARESAHELRLLIKLRKQNVSELNGTIGVSVLTLENPFFSVIADNIKTEAAQFGYNVIVMDAERSVQTQAEQVDYFLSKGVAAIVLNPCDRVSSGIAIKKANSAGVPVFTCDLKCIADGAEVVSHIASDNLQGGRLAGDAMIEALGQKGGEVVVLHFPQANSCKLRVQGFEERIALYNKGRVSGKINVVAVIDGGGLRDEGLKATEDLLQAHPKLTGIFAINDPSALGAREAVEKVGKEKHIKIVGFDGQPDGKRAIEKGRIFADPIQFPDKIGKKTVDIIMSYFKGEEVPAEVLIPFQLLQKDGLKPLPVTSPHEQIQKSRPRFAYITNGIDPFWNLCAAGVKIAEYEFGIECDVLMPPKGVVDQKRMIETLLAQEVDGIAVSPIDSENQTHFLNEVAKSTILITQDADAPLSDRLVFLGANNYKAGRALGKLVKNAIPEGGEVMLFVGRLEQLNARYRRQGVIDELLGRSLRKLAKVKFDPVGSANLTSEGSKYVILDTRTDNFDKAKAKSNAEDAITKHKGLKCMIGLFAYNAPACINALKDTKKLGQIKVCGFDEQDALLQAITSGHAYGTISQLPWEYGYESIKILKDIYEGNKPTSEYVEKTFTAVTKENVDAFWRTKKEMKLIGNSSLPVKLSRYNSRKRHSLKSTSKTSASPIEPRISNDLLKAVDDWKSIPQTVFPLPNVGIFTAVQFVAKDASGEIIAGATMQPGRQVVALGVSGGELILSPSKNGKMRGSTSIDDTDFKQGVAYLFELRKMQRSEYEQKLKLASKNKANDQNTDRALFEDIPAPEDFGHGKFCICKDCRDKRLASVDAGNSLSMSSNTDLLVKMEPKELTEMIQENLVDLKFNFETENRFIPYFTAKEEFESKAILMADGSFTYTIIHCEDGPFRILPEPFSLVNVSGEISSDKLNDKIILKELAWMDDPRILIIPLYVEQQVLKEKGLKIFTTPRSHSVPIDNAMSVDLSELSCKDSGWRLFKRNQGVLKKNSIQNKPNEIGPGEYVFNQRGDVLGITLNNEHLFWMKDLGSRLRANSRTLLGGMFDQGKTQSLLERLIQTYKRLDDVLKD